MVRSSRSPIYQEIQQIVSDEVPFLYIAFLQGLTHFSNRVQGLPEEVLGIDELYKKAYTWGLDPAS